MAMFIRAKRVSDPFDDKAKARLRGDDCHTATMTTAGYASSGSEHEADPLFSGPVHAFLQIETVDEPTASPPPDVSDNNHLGDSNDSSSNNADAVRDLLDPSKKNKLDPFLVRLHSDVVEIAKALGELRLNGRPLRLAVMTARLRELGYNAGICRAKWESSGSLCAGSYEYVDVVVDCEEEGRYVVDPEFSAEFEIARATEEYADMLAALPRVMVGRGEEVKQAVRTMARAARRSMESRGMEVPPWRKRRYMLAKWFGPYRRTTNLLPVSSAREVAAAAAAVKTAATGEEMVKCRAVGFGNVLGIIMPPATSTR